MNKTMRMACAVVGGVLIAGAVVTPALAAPAGPLTVTPATGQFLFGTGNAADSLTITPPIATCPSPATLYADLVTLPGAEDTAVSTGKSLKVITAVSGVVTVGQHTATFQNGQVQNLFKTILPTGTTDAALSADDAAKPVGTKIAEDTFSLVGWCAKSATSLVSEYGITTVKISAATRAPKPDDWDATHPGVTYDCLQWSWSIASAGPASTTTTLTADPAGTAPQGQAVNLAATVSPSGAAGTVEFFDGSTSLGTKTVSAGAASLSTSALSTGSHSLTAKFTPSDSTAFDSSTSTAVSYNVTSTGGSTGASGAVTIQTTVNPDTTEQTLTLTVNQSGAVTLPAASRSGDNLVTSANAVQLVTITDTRSNTAPGWSATGKVSANFVGADSSHTFSGKALGWKPLLGSQSTNQGVVIGPEVVAGGTTGLLTGATLATAPKNSGIGTAKLNADLVMSFPATTAADTYKADVTITVI